jgi:hypothetical protein
VRNWWEQSCGLRLTAGRSANLTFVPPPPGTYLNPWPLGTPVAQADYTNPLELTVNSATINATAEVEAVTNPSTGAPANRPPPTGDQYTLINLTATGPKGFSFPLASFLGDFISAEGVNSVPYKPDTCVPPTLDLGSIGTINPGQTVTGNICFTIASTDATTLLLRGTYDALKIGGVPEWFALH